MTDLSRNSSPRLNVPSHTSTFQPVNKKSTQATSPDYQNSLLIMDQGRPGPYPVMPAPPHVIINANPAPVQSQSHITNSTLYQQPQIKKESGYQIINNGAAPINSLPSSQQQTTTTTTTSQAQPASTQPSTSTTTTANTSSVAPTSQASPPSSASGPTATATATAGSTSAVTNSNGGPNPTRSSWVWNYFVQTPENQFRVQCQFHPNPSTGDICGVVLTRDKTGSTGSMCRHLSRVHQLTPTHVTTTTTSKKASTSGSGGSLSNGSVQSFDTSRADGSGNTAKRLSPSDKSGDGSGKRRLENGSSADALPNKRLKSPSFSSSTSTNASNKSKQRVKGSAAKTIQPTTSKPIPSNKFTPDYILSHVLPYYIGTGIVFYEPDFYRLKAHLLSTLQVTTLPTELHSYANFCIYAQQKYQDTQVSIKNELAKAPGCISICCGMWKNEETNATQSTRHIESNTMLVLTARYVDKNWSLRRLLLRLIPVRWYTTSVVDIIQQTARDYDISGRIYTIGIDRASYDPSAVPFADIAQKNKDYSLSVIPKDSLYYGLDVVLGQAQFDCGIDRKHLVFESPVGIVSKIVDDFVYGPKALSLIVKMEMAADAAGDSLQLRQQMDKIIVKEVVIHQQENASEVQDVKKRSERKSFRDYDDDDEDEYNMKRLALDGEVNNCNKDENDELVGWRSVYSLFKNGLSCIEQVRKYVDITDEEVVLLNRIVKILKPIFTTINDLKISSYDTAGVTAFAIETMIKGVVDASKGFGASQDPDIAEFVKSLERVYYDKLHDNMLFTCIEAMDPNFKRVYWHMSAERQEVVCETLRKGVKWVNERRKQLKSAEANAAAALIAASKKREENEVDGADEANSSVVTWNDILPSPVQASFNGSARVEDEDADISELAFGPDDEDANDTAASKSSATAAAFSLSAPAPAPAPVAAGSAKATSTTESSGPMTGSNTSSNSDEEDEEPSFFRTLVSREKNLDTLEFEVNEYLRAPTGKKFVDPYQWWKTKGQEQFPQLSRLALTYLAIPGWNTVVHNQQLFEGSAVLPCQRRKGRSQIVVKGGGGGSVAPSVPATPSYPANGAVSSTSRSETSEPDAAEEQQQQGPDSLEKPEASTETGGSSGATDTEPSSKEADSTPVVKPEDGVNPAPTAPATTNVTVLDRIRPEQEMCLRYWTRYYHSP